MKNIILLSLLAFATNLFSQINIVDTGSFQGYQVYQNGVYRSSQPKGESFMDIDPMGKISIKQMSGSQITQYFFFTNYRVNGVEFATFEGAIDTLGKAIGWKNSGSSSGIQSITAGTNINVDDTDPLNPVISASGGGGTPLVSNGLYIDNEDSIKLGGTLTENTDINIGDKNLSVVKKNSNNIETGFISLNQYGYLALYDSISAYLYTKNANIGVEDSVIQFSPGFQNGIDSLTVKFKNLKETSVDNLAGILGVEYEPSGSAENFNLYRVPASSFSNNYIYSNGVKLSNDSVKLGGKITEPTDIEISDTNRLFIGSRGNYGLNINEPIPGDFEDLGVSKILGFNAQDTAGYKYLSGILLYDEESGLHLNGQIALKGNPFSEDMQQGILSGVVNQNNAEKYGGDTINEVQILNIWKDDDVFFQSQNSYSPNSRLEFIINGEQTFYELKGFDFNDNEKLKKTTHFLNQSQQPLTGFTQDTTLFNFQTFNWQNNYNSQFLLRSDTAHIKTNGTILIDSKSVNLSDPWEGSRYYFANSGLKIVEGNQDQTSTNYTYITNAQITLSDGTETLTITPDKILIPAPPASGNYVLKSIGGVVQWVSE